MTPTHGLSQPPPDKDQSELTDHQQQDVSIGLSAGPGDDGRPQPTRKWRKRNASSRPDAATRAYMRARAAGDTLQFDTPPSRLAELEARDISAWFGDHLVLDSVSL